MKRWTVVGAMAVLSVACGEGADPVGGARVEAETRATLTTVQPHEQLDGCEHGGSVVELGIDADGSGFLSPNEVQQQVRVCNGAPGAQGAPGAAGASALSSVIDLGAHDPRCELGGVEVAFGADANANGILEPDEVQARSPICHAGPVSPDGDDDVETCEQDIQEVLAKDPNLCLACHSGPSGMTSLDLTNGAALVGKEAVASGACAGGLIIDPVDPEESVLLRKLRPGTDLCGSVMPLGSSTGVSDEDFACFREWVMELAAGGGE